MFRPVSLWFVFESHKNDPVFFAGAEPTVIALGNARGWERCLLPRKWKADWNRTFCWLKLDFDTKPAWLSCISNMPHMCRPVFIFNIFGVQQLRGQKRCNGNDPMVTEAGKCTFFFWKTQTKPPLHPSFLYLSSLPCSLHIWGRVGWPLWGTVR